MKKELLEVTKITIEGSDKARALSLILSENISYKNAISLKNGKLEIKIKRKQREQFEKLFNDNNICAEFINIDGKLSFLKKLKHRYGIFVGLIMLFILIFVSKNLVWKINVTGNVSVNEKEILNQLENVGFSLGVYIPKINYDYLHNEFLRHSDNISWISVNIVGNTANVKVKEKKDGAKKDDIKYSNIVAKYDGQIASISTIEGKRVISIGDVVKKGDILISGIIDSSSQGVRYERAQGEIKAYTNKVIDIKIPFNTTKKVYTGNKCTTIIYKILNFPIKFNTKYGNSEYFYDTIKKTEKVCFLNFFYAPIEIEKTVFLEYYYETKTNTAKESVDIAFSELKKEMEIHLKDAELISKKIETSYDDEYFYITCNLYCLEEISEESIFYLE